MTASRRFAPLPLLLIALLALLALAMLALGGVLLWSAPAEAQTATVLVKNTGQTDSGDYGMGVGGNSKRAQAFTTGANPAGYTLGSIGFSFGGIASTSTAGGDLAVTLHADSSGDPASTALCTLTDPRTFSGSGLQTFDALTTDPCGTLEANKTYFAVVQRVANTATSTISLDVTADDNEDTGGATGWTIGDASYVVVTPGTAWVKNANFNYQVAVRGYAINNPATGAPTITGTPRVGEELTADTSAIMDADGITPSNFTYQWVRVVGASETNIGMDTSTYTLTDDDAERRIRVDVTFDDDLTNAEGPLSSALSDTIVPADVLVRNTKQTRRSSGEDFDSQSPDVIAQGFTTGANAGGYTLDSIGVHFFNTANNLSPAVNRISATLNAGSSSEPGAELCSLTNPATFGGSGLYTFSAPTMGTTCPTLHAGTTYWVLVKNDSRTTSHLSVTDNDEEDPGGAAGWSIGDGHTQRQGSVSSFAGQWFSNTRPLLIEVKGSAASNNFATGAPSISGVLQQDEVLTADTAGVADADGVGTFSYQWLADGAPISGATSSTYTLTASEVRDAISLTVTFTDDEGYSELLTSAETHDVVASGATRKLLWVGTLTPGDRGSGAVGVNVSNNDGFLSPFKFTYGSDTYTIEQIDFGPLPSSGLLFAMSPVPGADEEVAWIVDTGREWLVSDDDVSISKSAGQVFLLWPAVAEDVDWTIGEETVVYLLEVFNNPPAFTDTAPTTRSVDENTASAADIGAAVAASDPESDTLVYALTGTDASSFTIDTASGQLKTSASLDFETDDSYSVNVTVHDGKNAVGVADTTVDATIAVTISANNLDEAGTVTLPATFTGGTAATASVTDPDGAVTSPSWRWAWGNTANGSFTDIDGATAAGYTPVAADVGKYLRATVAYTDPQGSGKTASAVSSSAVGANNAEPAFSADSATRTLPENSLHGASVVGGAITATDTDGDALTYSLTGTDAARFEIDSDGQIKVKTGSTHTFNFESTKKSYSVTVNVRDSKDAAGNADTAVDDSIAVTIDLTNVNEAPVIANTEAGISRPENTTFVVAFSALDVDDSTTLTWSIESTADGGKFEINATTGLVTSLSFKNAPDFETPGSTAMNNTYVVTVKVTDDGSPEMSDTHTYTVTVTNVNEAPKITTLAATYTGFNVDENTATSVVIKTYEAEDVDANSVLTWDVHGADASDFTITKNANGHGELKFANAPNFESPADAGTDNVYDVTVRVRDAGGLSTLLMVQVTVTDVNEAPVITSPPATRSVPENTTAVHTFAADDVDDSDTQTWSVESADDGGKFDISSTGALSFKNAPDFETPTQLGGTNNDYVVTVKVTDAGSLSNTHEVTVTVTNVNEAPEITTNSGAAYIFSEEENTPTTEVIETFEATDVDASTTLTWSLQGADAGDFTITKNAQGQGELKFKNVPDFEDPKGSLGTDRNVYIFEVKVRDNHSPRKEDTIGVNLHVTDVNEAPEITSPPATRSVPENSTAVHTFAATDVDASDTRLWSVETAADGSKFTINQSTGALSFTTAPDFETPNQSGSTDNQYVVTVKVTDAGGLSDTHEVTVTVTDVNETPSITSGPATIAKDENTATAEVIATYVATDPDATTGTMSWDLMGNDAGDFTITSTVNGTANLYFAASPNFEGPADTGTNNGYDVTVRVRDNGDPRLQDTQGVAITVEDVNETPVISGDNSPDFAEIEFDATSAVLTIGTYMATDDEGDSVTWAVSGTDAGHFSINSTTGELSFDINPDFENPVDTGSNNMYAIVLEAEDDNAQGGKTGTKTGTYAVTVTVTNVDETPEITTDGTTHTAPSFMEIEYDATTADLVVADYDGRDEEGQTITWSLTGTDAGDFSIDSMTGVLSFAQRPNYEIPVDADTDNVYNVTVRARDTASNTRDLAVVVTATDVNERPDIDENFNAPQTYMEIEYDFTGTRPDVHTFTATDYDAGDTIGWALAGTDAAYLDIDPTTGVLTFRQDADFGQGPLPNFEHPRDDDAGDGSSNTYTIIVRAFDDATEKKTTEYAVVVTVTDVNEVPEFTGTPETAITLDEHDANDNYVVMDLADYGARDEEGGVTWSLTGTDRGDFAISADGVVTFAKTPDYEAPEDSGGDNGYAFNVVATDEESGASRRTVSVAVTVTVGDVEEAGTLTVDNVSPAAGDTLTFVLTDPDGSIDTTSTASITWEIQSLVSGGEWTRVSRVLTPASTTFPWVVDEDVTEKKLRAMVTYTDRRGSGKTALSDETAEVTPDPIVNAPPRFRGSSTWSVEEGPAGRAVGAPTSVTDRDNDTLTYGIEASLDSALFEIDPSTGQVRLAQAVDFETMSEPYALFIYLTLHDGRDAEGNAETVPTIDARRSASVFVTDVEEDGVVTLSTDAPGVEEAVTATLEDGDGGVSGEAWQWARSLNGQTGWSNISGAASSSYTTTRGDAEFFLRATVSYTDRRGDGKSALAVTARRVLGDNQPPTFPPAEDGQRTIAENPPAGGNIGEPVAAEDPENDALTYALSGMDAGAFTIVETTGQLRVKDALDFETKDRYEVTVEVHDRLDTVGDASTTVDDTLEVTITVENVEEPGVVTLATDTGTIQARVEVTAALSDDDVPTGVAWQWARSPDGSTDWVNIAGATSATYMPTLLEDAGSYLRARASYDDGHGLNKTAEAVSARVGDAPSLNSAPAFPATEDGQREVAENAADGTAVGTPVGATDLNAGNAAVNDPLVYSLSGTDAASFTIDAGTGQIRVEQNVELDFEGKKTYQVSVEVSDGRDQYGDDDMDAVDATRDVIITVTNVNEAPVVTGDTTVSYPEDANRAIATYSAADPERGTLTWTVSDDAFRVTNSGQLFFQEQPNFEGQRVYTVTVTVTDDDASNPLSDSLAVTITVEDVEELGMVTLTTATGRVQARVEVTAALSDGDGPTGVSWQWARSPDGRTDWVDIAGATSAMYTPTLEEDRGNYLRARASYDDGRGTNKTAEKVSARVDDPPSVNSAPVFPATESGQREVAENAVAGTAVGAPVGATDLNAGNTAVNDPLVYTLSGADAASFTIDAGTGQIRVGENVALDFEGRRTYRVTVEVTDGADQNGDDDMDAIDARQNVTITVTNLNEAPEVRGDATVSYPEDANRAIATYTATDPERGTLTWSVSGADDTEFWISQRGQFHFRSPPSSETRMNYTVTVTATDDATPPLSGTLAVTVTVTDVEEAGTLTIEPTRGWDGSSFTAGLDDDDGGITGETWQWARSSNRSSWSDIAGATLDSYTAGADDINNYLRVTVTYTDRRGSDKEASAAVTGRIEDSNDRPVANTVPEFTEDDDDTDAMRTTTRSVGQGTAAGRSVGAPVRATDADPGDVLTYSLIGTDAGLFDIDPATGQIRTKVVLDYDPHGTNTYSVEVRVHDGFDASYSLSDASDATIEVTITVTAVAQRSSGGGSGGGGGGGGFGPAPTAPKFVDGFRTERPLAVTARPGDAVGDPVEATHPNDDEVTYSLSGANAALFTVDGETGQIRLGEAARLEVGQTYTVNLTATDSTGTGAIIIVTIVVAEAPYHRYDLNRNGSIEKDEVLRAIGDYFAGRIEKGEVLALVSRYFAA